MCCGVIAMSRPFFTRKRALLLILGLILVVGLGYAVYYFTTPYTAEPSPYTGEPAPGITLQTDQSVYPADVYAIPVTIRNDSDNYWEGTDHGILERQENGQWYTLSILRGITQTSMGWSAFPGESKTYSVLVGTIYGPRLKPGHYRIVMAHFSFRYAAVEFDIK